MVFSEQLSKLRKEANMTQEDLAEKCDVSRQAIAKWESGESTPTIDKLIFLADLYELSLDELVGRKKFDKYMRIREYLHEFAAKDIPIDDEDDICAIVSRYFTFAESTGLSVEDQLKGLKDIFLTEKSK